MCVYVEHSRRKKAWLKFHRRLPAKSAAGCRGQGRGVRCHRWPPFGGPATDPIGLQCFCFSTKSIRYYRFSRLPKSDSYRLPPIFFQVSQYYSCSKLFCLLAFDYLVPKRFWSAFQIWGQMNKAAAGQITTSSSILVHRLT